MKTLLLHTCCAPCACGCIGRLQEEGRNIVLFFSNSNINTREEFDKRLAEVEKFAAHFSLELVIDPYRHEDWLEAVSKVPDFAVQPERGLRCAACFEWALGRTALAAQERGMTFATTLTVSPYKNSRMILAIGARHDHFEPYDFKKKDGYLKSLRLSAELGLYRQNYCGCEFSCLSHKVGHGNALE